ncbi:hypothetical protein [Streptomyces sp. NBC_00046]|uniref:hypothetical protein n=1 Tax=unclassified Streptomyces TaxID=2593676 RepID=UPI003246FD07
MYLPHIKTPTTDTATLQLPPYSGEFTTCQKCGYDSTATRYRAAGEHSTHDRQTVRPSAEGERLERQC